MGLGRRRRGKIAENRSSLYCLWCSQSVCVCVCVCVCVVVKVCVCVCCDKSDGP